MIRKITLLMDIVAGAFALAKIAATVKKDIGTHASHDRHNPCGCQKACLRCLF